MEPSITPLSDFTPIGHNLTLHTPSTYTPTTSPLILLFTWNAAFTKHISKYVLTYQRLFPHAQILLIRCYTSDMFVSSPVCASRLAPALDVAHAHIKQGGEVLVHSFSNGGGNQVNEFAKAWRGRFGGMLPMRCQILDSSPTQGDWMKSHAAISAGLPGGWFWRWFGKVGVHGLLVGVWVLNVLLRRENKMVVLCRELNDEDMFDNGVPRVYLYSRADQMVGWEEVEGHAAVARSTGWDVEIVRFEGSAHCGHVREDEGRYWGAVLEAWKRGGDGGVLH